MKKSKLCLIAFVLGILAVAIEAGVLFGDVGSTNAYAKLGAAIGKTIVFPSFIAMVVAVILNAVGYFAKMRSFILATAIVYVVALVLMPTWGFLGIPSMILCFVAFSKTKQA